MHKDVIYPQVLIAVWPRSVYVNCCGGIADVLVNKSPHLFLDLFKYRLINSKLINSTFLHNKEGCMLDFSDENNAYMIYFVSFLGTLAVLPGNIVSALLMDKIGRLRMLGKKHKKTSCIRTELILEL